MDIVFLCYDRKDATFFSEIDKVLELNYGLKSIVLSFSLELDNFFQRSNTSYFSIIKNAPQIDKKSLGKAIIDYEEKYNLPTFREIINHQKIAHSIKNDEILYTKALRYAGSIEKFFSKYSPKFALHEIGGWIGSRLLEVISQNNNCKNIYIEPSPFRGRVLLFKNSYFPKIQDFTTENYNEYISVVEDFINSSIKSNMVIKPFKDLDKYHDVRANYLFTKRRFLSPFKAFYRRYVINKGDELVAPLLTIFKYHVYRYINRKILKHFCSIPNVRDKYVYFPLHMPVDMQILVRSPQYYDQYYLLEYISRTLPVGYKLYFKEHPVCVGTYDFFKMKSLSKLHNVRMIDPMVNSHELIKNSCAIITVNSKVGFEALLYSKPVITLGYSFYRGNGLTIDVTNLIELPQKIRESNDFKINPEKLKHFISRVYKSTFKGELYKYDYKNYSDFAKSIYECISNDSI